MTFWRRPRGWQAAGVWDEVHHSLLDRLGQAGQMEWNQSAASTPPRTT